MFQWSAKQTAPNFVEIFKNHRFSWFCGNHKILPPIYRLATGTTMSSKIASSHSWHLLLAARWELSWIVNQKPLSSSTWVSLGGYLGFAEHNGWGPIRNVPSCRLLKTQPQKCSKSPLLYYIGPRVLKHRLCLLRGVEVSHFQKKHMGREIVLWSSFKTQSTRFWQGKPYLFIRILQQNFGIFMSSIYESMNFRVKLSSSIQKHFKWDFEWSFRFHWFNKCLLSAY